jgi:hypothetical protein
MKWSYAYAIKGMVCTHVTESKDTHGGWNNNFLCLPASSPFMFRWSSIGAIAESKQCIQWLEVADPASWRNNFLCVDLKTTATTTATATASSVHNNNIKSFGPKFALDGKNSKIAGFLYISARENRPWLQIMFPNKKKIRAVKITNR